MFLSFLFCDEPFMAIPFSSRRYFISAFILLGFSFDIFDSPYIPSYFRKYPVHRLLPDGGRTTAKGMFIR